MTRKELKDKKVLDAKFFTELDELIQKYNSVGLIHMIGLLEFAKMALLHEGDKVISKLEKGED